MRQSSTNRKRSYARKKLKLGTFVSGIVGQDK